MGLVAADALSSSVVRVSAEARVADVLAEIEKTHATHATVYDGDTLLGVVSLHATLWTRSQNIFADLARQSRVPRVPSTSTVEFVSHLFDQTGVTGASVHDADGTFRGVVDHESILGALLVDTRGHLEEILHLKTQQERLRLLGQIASGVAHDLNNCLMPVIGLLELVAQSATLDDRARRDVESARTAALDAAQAVKRLQGFYAHEPPAGDRHPVDLFQVARDVRDLTRPTWHNEAQRQGRNIEVLVEVEGTPLARAHPSEVREILTNLVLNAAHAIPGDGTIRIRCSRGEQCALLEVTDTGVGMTDEQRRRCFEPFYTTRPGSGTGLGLSVCCDLVQACGGDIDVESAPMQGTTFRVALPLVVAPAPTPPVDMEIPLHRWKVLYVDNEPRLHAPVRRMLEVLGQQVTVCGSGEEALERFRGESFDLVLTDLTMPRMTGVELVRSLRIIRPQIPIILVTGWADVAIIESSVAPQRPEGIVHKPFTLPTLRRALAEIQQLRS